MIAKLIVEGKEFPIEIQDPELQKLFAPQKKTGYERVSEGQMYWLQDMYDGAVWDTEPVCRNENNARADELMRQLRRFAVEHRVSNVSRNECMYSITYCIFNEDVKLKPNKMINCHYMDIWFDTEDVAWQAINMFYNELIWYFTEYKDSL